MFRRKVKGVGYFFFFRRWVWEEGEVMGFRSSIDLVWFFDKF